MIVVSFAAFLLVLLAASPLDAQTTRSSERQSLWDHFASVADVAPGPLWLLVLDIDNDGRDEMFLAPASTCGTGGCTWQVYSSAAGRDELRYLGAATFPEAGFRLTRGTGTITFCGHMSADECALGEYAIRSGTMTHRTLGTCRSGTPACQTELDRIARWQRDQPPVFQAEVPSSGDLDHLTWSPQPAGRGRAVPPLNGLMVAGSPHRPRR